MGLLYDLIISVFVLTALAAIFGNFLDKKLNTLPFFSIAFGILAIIFGLARLVVKSAKIDTRNKNKGENEKGKS